jgi:hypothetical protein
MNESDNVLPIILMIETKTRIVNPKSGTKVLKNDNGIGISL